VNLASLLDGHDPAAVALVHRNRSTTYGELVDRVARVRGGLAGLGLAAGDRIGLTMANSPAFAVAELASLGLGLVVVPLNPDSPPAEIEAQLAAVGVRAVVADAGGRRAIAGTDRERLPDLEHVIVTDAGVVAEARTDGTSPSVTSSLDELLQSDPMPVAEVADDHLAALLFTSGTAGAPRAAMLSHGNLQSNLDQIGTSPDRIGPDDVVFGVLPLFHIYGLNVALHATLARGATLVMVQRFDPATALDTIRERGVTVVPGAPSMWHAFAVCAAADPAAFATVRLALSGAAKLSEADARTLESRFGVQVREGYGLTEASPAVTTSLGVAPRYGSIGVALPGVDVRLVDTDGSDVLTDDAGEIWVRGPNVFKGYWDDPEATARVLTSDGWLRTGDIAVVDDDGYLYIVDRAKDLIIVSGFNVYPAEVEDVIGLLPGVLETAVVGVAHPHTGEAVKAFVVTDADSAIDEERVIEHCEKHVARYKCPSKVMFVDALPRNPAGKLLRRALR
jgi:long-chain acyl-CoA synthetase